MWGGLRSAQLTWWSQVRAAHARAILELQQIYDERIYELVRLLQQEEQTRCQAFQAAMMGEVHAGVYQNTVRSILEKLLAKLESLAFDQMLYRDAARCLSEYMSSLNHHCDTCATPVATGPNDRSLKAIVEADTGVHLLRSPVCSPRDRN